MGWSFSRHERIKRLLRLGEVGLWAALNTLTAQHVLAEDVQDQKRSLLVLRKGDLGVDARVVRDVDEAIAKALARSGRFLVHFSETPYAEAKLVAGCGDRVAVCLTRLTDQLASESLLLRSLARDGKRGAKLTLAARAEGPGKGMRTASAVLSSHKERPPEQVVSLLLARLYGPLAAPHLTQSSSPARKASHVEVATSRSSEPAAVTQIEQRHPKLAPRAVIGWSSLAGAGAMMLTGTMFALLSERDEQAYAEQEIRTASEVDHAETILARSEREARIANGLLIGGAGLAAFGASMLLWQRFARRDDSASATRWGAAPVPGGAAVLIGGVAEGRRRR